jgi:hypothetical protein
MRAWLVTVLAGVIGCGGEASASSSSSSDAANNGVDCCDIVRTPAGPAARACVHEVPNGGTVSSDDDSGYATVTAADGAVVGVFGPCPCGAAQLALCD